MIFSAEEPEFDSFIEISPGVGSPEISILMPVYQQAAFVADAVFSILSQKGVVAEIIFSDDASEDGTYFIARDCVIAWLKRHPLQHRIILRRGSARLRRDHLPLLLEKASCDLVFQAHGDDISHCDRAKILLYVFRTNPGVTMITSTAKLIHAAENTLAHEFPAMSPIHQARHYSMEEILQGDKHLIGYAMAWSRTAQSGFTRLDSKLAAVSHDRITAFRAGMAGKVLLIHTPLVNRRVSQKNWSMNMVIGKDPQVSRFGWSLIKFSALEVMAGDVLKAEEIGLINRENCRLLTGQIATLQESFKRQMLDAHRVLTGNGFLIHWLEG